MLRYSDLSEAQKEFITNGCGGKGGLLKPPNFIFKASCNPHDFYYWRGCTEEQRKISDDKFFELMREDIKEIEFSIKEKWHQRYLENIKISALKSHYHIWAFSYYKFVRVGGKKYFYYGNKMKTMLDLDYEMKIRGL